jgi:hypothetical protein
VLDGWQADRIINETVQIGKIPNEVDLASEK